MCLLHSTPAVAPPPAALASVPLLGGTPLNLQLLVTLVYATTYVREGSVYSTLFLLVHQVIMDPVAGSLAAAMVLFLHKWTFGILIIFI